MYAPTKFDGELKHENARCAVSFEVSIDNSGVLHIKLDRLTRSVENRFIEFESMGDKSVAYFTISATADDADISSDSFYVTQLNSRSDENGSYFEVQGTCSEATLRFHAPRPKRKTGIRRMVRGFRCFGPLIADHALGRVAMGGAHEISNYNEITGQLAIEAPEAAGSSWFDEANELLDHVTHVISFASGAFLRVPLVERVRDGQVETVVRSVGRGHEPFVAPFHYLDLSPIFRVAVASNGSEATRPIREAIEWMLMPVTYNELHLLVGMTALENLIFRNVKGGTPSPEIDVLREKVEGCEVFDAGERRLLDSVLARLNDPPLRKKIMRLVSEWGISLEDLDEERINAIAGARSLIVHRGVYYGQRRNQKELWDHLLPLYELLTRLILSAIAYKGNYVSHFRKRLEIRSFPDCRPVGSS